eukprot:9484428-Pyramimonas_sp.AAC.1
MGCTVSQPQKESPSPMPEIVAKISKPETMPVVLAAPGLEVGRNLAEPKKVLAEPSNQDQKKSQDKVGREQLSGSWRVCTFHTATTAACLPAVRFVLGSGILLAVPVIFANEVA